MTYTFPHRHLLEIGQLSEADIGVIFERAERYVALNRSASRKTDRLSGKTVVTLFYEPSTRTRTSFEIGAKRLGADVVSIPVEHSSAKKGETLLDTALNLDAMQIDALVIRHPESGAPASLAPHISAHIVNGGDGVNEHPTQALYDAFTMLKRKKTLQGLTVAICGDVIHSRVAHSNIRLLKKMGARVRTVAPPFFADALHEDGVEACSDMKDGLHDADVVMMLRIQHERMASGDFAMSLNEYHKLYGLDHAKLAWAKPDAIVMHPGPINRGVELTDAVADDPKHSVIREQVENAVAMRMAVVDILVTGS